VSVLKIIIF